MQSDLTPKSQHWLNNLVCNIENSVQIYFPNHVKRDLRFEYLSPLGVFEKILEGDKNESNKEYDKEEKKVALKKKCEGGEILGYADSINNRAYLVKKSIEDVVKEDLIEDFIFEDADYIGYKLSKPKEKKDMITLIESLITVHKLGHILLDHLLPKMTSFKTQIKEYLSEAFADYIMIKYYNKMCNGIDRKFQLVIELLIENREMNMARKKHLDNMFSSNNPLGYIKEKLDNGESK